jgi:hypothetical protein
LSHPARGSAACTAFGFSSGVTLTFNTDLPSTIQFREDAERALEPVNPQRLAEDVLASRLNMVLAIALPSIIQAIDRSEPNRQYM